MSEDVSATMRVGITVILVAALVATVLNLMVMSNSLLSNGQTTLQSGIDSVSTQEFASYDNTKVSGTQVATALSMFQGRDVAIVIQTKSFATLAPTEAVNYGALLTCDGNTSTTSNMPTSFEAKTVKDADTGKDKLAADKKGDSSDISAESALNFITSQAKTAYIVKFSENEKPSTGYCAFWREKGAANYTGYLHNSSGLVDSSYDIIGTTELGNAAFILSSSRFSSTLIKDPTGSIIGIFFKQLQ